MLYIFALGSTMAVSDGVIWFDVLFALLFSAAGVAMAVWYRTIAAWVNHGLPVMLGSPGAALADGNRRPWAALLPAPFLPLIGVMLISGDLEAAPNLADELWRRVTDNLVLSLLFLATYVVGLAGIVVLPMIARRERRIVRWRVTRMAAALAPALVVLVGAIGLSLVCGYG
ncbi:hypothetical protein GCM10009816_19140 [Microbacterium aquimaris]